MEEVMRGRVRGSGFESFIQFCSESVPLRHTDSHTDRETDRHAHTDRHTHTQTVSPTHRYTATHTHTQSRSPEESVFLEFASVPVPRPQA